MRRFILGIAMLMAVPAYTVAQQRDRSGPPSGRTAIPREQAVQMAPAGQSDRRAERRGESRTRAPRDEKPDDAARSRADREHRRTSSGGDEERGRRRDERPQTHAAPLNPGYRTSLNPGYRTSLNPGFLAPINPGFRTPVNPLFQPFPDRGQGHPWQRGDFRSPYRRAYNGANVVFVPYAAPVVVEREVVVERDVVDEAALAPAVVATPQLARLILDIHPPTAQVFADGYYIGIPEDFRFENGGAALEPGPHRIEILARDHEPVSFDVNLTRGQSATFRQTLRPIIRPQKLEPRAAVDTPPAPKRPAMFYLIPGCYMGNVPPKEANLPATCDIARVVTFQY